MSTVNTECIREEMADVVNYIQSPINSSKRVLVRRFAMTDPQEACIAAEDLRLRTSVKNTADLECHYVDDPMASQVTYPGRYRGVTVKEVTNGNTFFIEQTLSAGLVTTFDPTLAFITMSNAMSGNATAISGISNTTSNDPEKYLNMLVEGVDPNYTQSVIDAIRAYNWNSAQLSFVSLDGVTISGACHLVYAKTKKQDDETDTVEFLLARPQFTLQAYQNFGSDSQEDSYYLWNVPKILAQDIIDDWKTDVRKWATASYRGDGLVDIMLSSRSNKDNTATDLQAGVADQFEETLAATESTERHSAATNPEENSEYDPNNGKGTLGTIIATANEPNGDGTFRTMKKTTVAHKQQWQDQYDTKDGTVYFWVGKACTDMEYSDAYSAAGLTSATSNTLNVTVRPDGLYDYYIEKRPYGGTSQNSWYIGEISHIDFLGPKIYKQNKAGEWKYKQNWYRERVSQFSSHDHAMEFMRDGRVAGEIPAQGTRTAILGLKGTPIGSSRCEILSNGQYLVTHICANEENEAFSGNLPADTTDGLADHAKATWELDDSID